MSECLILCYENLHKRASFLCSPRIIGLFPVHITKDCTLTNKENQDLKFEFLHVNVGQWRKYYKSAFSFLPPSWNIQSPIFTDQRQAPTFIWYEKAKDRHLHKKVEHYLGQNLVMITSVHYLGQNLVMITSVQCFVKIKVSWFEVSDVANLSWYLPIMNMMTLNYFLVKQYPFIHKGQSNVMSASNRFFTKYKIRRVYDLSKNLVRQITIRQLDVEWLFTKLMIHPMTFYTK